MTKAFCHIVLHYSIASLSWKTVKSLRRSRNRHRGKQCGDSEGVIGQENDGRDVVTDIDYEILKGWTIIAFHYLYVSMRIEYFVRFVVPFYYHLKMIVLIATFVVPTWTVTSDGTSGLSPVVSYWFDYLIIPGVHKVHTLMGHDPKQWVKLQLAMLPLRFIDFFILPGILATEEEKQLVKKNWGTQDKLSGDVANMIFSSKISPCQHDKQMISHAATLPQNINEDYRSAKEDTDKVPRQVQFDPTSRSRTLQKQENENVLISCDQSLLEEISDCYNSTVEDARTTMNTNKWDSVSKASRKLEAKEKGSAIQQSDESKNIRVTPPRVLRDSTLFNEISPKQTPKTLFPKTSPPLSTEHSYCSISPTSSRKSSFSNSIFPPVAKSRLESSALRLRRISQEHRLRSVFSPHKISSRGSASFDDGDNETIGSCTEVGATENEIHLSSVKNTRRKRGERLSLGDHFRELVTGDANVRVRDHLFDLDLPTSPRAHLQEERQMNNSRSNTLRNLDSSNITTRRSSRLAKKTR